VNERPGVWVLVAAIGSPVARSTCESRFNRADLRMRCTVDGAMPSRAASWTGPSRRRIRKLTHRFVVERFVLFGEDLGRDDRSCMDLPAR
jgi:hypothetical protein